MTLPATIASAAVGPPTAAAPRLPPGLGISIIAPTFREAENIPYLVQRLKAVAVAHHLDMELLLLDDQSDDGTPQVVADLQEDSWVRLIVRTGPRGLSAAVLDGLAAGRHPYLMVMDADLSHPPEAIPEMLSALLEPGVDFVIGSRYIPGGATDASWGLIRWLNSKVATLMARPFTHVRDPMSGFLGLPRRVLEQAAPLNPVGYKIGLELIVKCHCRQIREVPIYFADRVRGQSKLSMREQLRYVRHVLRLLAYKLFGICLGKKTSVVLPPSN